MVQLGSCQVLSIFDTGSTYNFISYNCACLTHCVMHPLLHSDCNSVLLADESILQIVGKCYLNVQLQKHSAYAKFFVAESLSAHLILGDAFFRRFKGQINYRTNEITFSENLIPIIPFLPKNMQNL